MYFAEAAIAAGDPELALSTLDQATAAAGEEILVLASPVARVRGSALMALGRLPEAGECFASALAEARRQSALYHELLTLRDRALLALIRGEEPDTEEMREAGRLAHLLDVPETPYPEDLPQLSMSE